MDWLGVNDRLYDLTKKLYEKTYALYKAILRNGYDPDFDDDIMVLGTLTYLVDSWEDPETGDPGSVLKMEEDQEYGSDFQWMMGLIDNLTEMKEMKACVRIGFSYNPMHNPDMTAEQLGIVNTLDDGRSWDHQGIFKGLCICNAIYELTSNNLYSYPDVLRMNDFWCEVQITHQLLTDLKGKRYSVISNRF